MVQKRVWFNPEQKSNPVRCLPRPVNLKTMTHGSLFSGIGGFDLAAEWMDWENVFHCERDGFCKQILKYYWPNAKHYGDIDETDFNVWKGRVDVLSGGFPCQPYSTAGNRKGKEDNRHKWPQMLRAIREISPRWVVGENVRGLTNWNGGLVFDEVQADLEAEGYEVLPFLLPACAVNAPHRRDRIWFVAHANNSVYSRIAGGNEKEGKGEGIQERNQVQGLTKSNNLWDAPNSDYKRCKGGIKRKQTTPEKGYDKKDSPARELQYSGFGDGLPSPRIFRANDGLPNGVDRVKALGNAVVPQVVYQIFKAIEQYEKLI